MKIKIPEEQRTHLEVHHKIERDGRVRDHIKAVLLANEDWTYRQIAQALRTHEKTIPKHISDYFREKKLKPMNGGSRRFAKAA